MSLHVFVGLALIPAVLLKLASTGWRFARYYTRKEAYVEHGTPQIAMRLLAPLFVAATVVLFSSGVAMGILHGHALVVARRLHGPASVVWLALFGVHALVYLKQALVSSSDEVIAAGPPLPGRRRRGYVIATAVASGLVIGAVTVPAQHHWVRLPRDHHDRRATPRAAQQQSPGPALDPGSGVATAPRARRFRRPSSQIRRRRALPAGASTARDARQLNEGGSRGEPGFPVKQARRRRERRHVGRLDSGT
jgi:hypothetical protein